MPRPGPRPYECVRRAWHSDRHQPMRGTLIQEIFRMANEMHNPATRKNKEWQEKLPAVVLKAEEIMYSKANSESEYMDLKTLHDRANDAIETIIRKDDSTESGDLLQPCIEAALNLGCIPRRASRSQRYNNPGCYLNPVAKDVSDTMKVPESSRTNIGHLLQMTPGPGNTKISASQCPYWYSTSFKPMNGISSIQAARYNGSDSAYVHRDPGVANYECPFPSKSSFLSGQGGLPFGMEASFSPRLSEVYPLFYSDDQSETFSSRSLQTIVKTYYNAKTPLPCDQSPAKTQIDSSPDYNKKSTATAPEENSILEEIPPKNTGCDLSLQLGLPCATSLCGESAWASEHEDVGSNSSCDGSRFDQSHVIERARNSDSLLSPKDKGFGFELLDEPLESFSSKRSSQGERIFYNGVCDRKRKASATAPFN